MERKAADVENATLSDEDKKTLEELAKKVTPSDYIAAFNRPRFAGAIRQQLAELINTEDESPK